MQKSRTCANCAHCQLDFRLDRVCRHPLNSGTIVSADAGCTDFVDRDDVFVEMSDEFDRGLSEFYKGGRL